MPGNNTSHTSEAREHTRRKNNITHFILSLCILAAGIVGFRIGYRFIDPGDGFAYAFSIVFLWFVLSALASAFWSFSGINPFWFVPIVIIGSVLVCLSMSVLFDFSLLILLVPAALIPVMIMIIINRIKRKKVEE